MNSYSNEFNRWLHVNGVLYAEFVKLARLAKLRGRSHWSARAIMHVLRWNSEVADAGVVFKINNNITAELSLYVMDCNEDLAGFFRVRDKER